MIIPRSTIYKEGDIQYGTFRTGGLLALNLYTSSSGATGTGARNTGPSDIIRYYVIGECVRRPNLSVLFVISHTFQLA